MRLLATCLCVFAFVATVPSAVSAAVPVPRTWHAPRQWLLGAVCIHNHEGAWNDNTGNTYFGGLQFLESTWLRAGGHHEVAFDHPGDVRFKFAPTPREQLFRAYTLWLKDGKSWREWGTRGACGL